METETIDVPYRKTPLPIERELTGPRLCLTEGVVRSIGRLLPKRVGRKRHENVLYIAGTAAPDQRVGIAVIAPHAITGPGFYTTDRDSHSEVMDILDDLDLFVVAQVHCHPGGLVSHSNADDDLAFVRAEGFWSIVVPEYGIKGMKPFARCGFHRFTRGEFRLLTEEAVSHRITVIPDSVKSTKIARGTDRPTVAVR
jgi:hypothetical protein